MDTRIATSVRSYMLRVIQFYCMFPPPILDIKVVATMGIQIGASRKLQPGYYSLFFYTLWATYFTLFILSNQENGHHVIGDMVLKK